MVFSLATGFAVAQDSPCPAPLKVGLKIVQVTGGPKMAVWYPTVDAETVYQYSSDVAGSVARDGRISTCRRFPLVVFSHGYGGCGFQSLFLTEQLARTGYVVAAPDHKDALCSVDGSGSSTLLPSQESFLAPQDWTDQTYLDRRNDMGKAIDFVLASPDLSPGVDPGRIGAMGHSLGGYTVIGLAGGWTTWKDPRVKAVLGLSPYSLPFLVVDRLHQIDIPVMLQGAQGDIGITPFLMGNTGVYGRLQPPKFFLQLQGGTHFEWTNLLCLGISTINGCLASRPNAPLIVGYARGFFDLYLNQSDSNIRQLNGAGLTTYQRLVPLTSVQAASYVPGAAVSPESIVAGFGATLSPQTITPGQPSLPQTLANVSVAVTDSSGSVRTAPLYLVSPGQINYVLPTGVATGPATIAVWSAGAQVATGNVQVASVAPSVFSAKGSGAGAAAAQYLRAGSGSGNLIDIFDTATLEPIPIDLGGESDQVYLVIYGSGMRGKGQSIQATIGGTATPVAGPFVQSTYAGLDQVNLGPLPRSLAARGVMNIVLTVDGKPTNPVTVNIR
ncbi:MAG: hypothetical protein ABUS51_09250 [Acidobacteriota bacterium]